MNTPRQRHRVRAYLKNDPPPVSPRTAARAITFAARGRRGGIRRADPIDLKRLAKGHRETWIRPRPRFSGSGRQAGIPQQGKPGFCLAGTVQLDPLPVHVMIWQAVFMDPPLRIQ